MLEEETNLCGTRLNVLVVVTLRYLSILVILVMLEEETNPAGNQVKRPGSCYSRISLYSRDLSYAGRRNQPGR